jgi:LPS-assembly protein
MLSLASPCLADAPPLGYVGPVPGGSAAWGVSASPPSPSLPIGYIGPVPRSLGAPVVKAASANPEHEGETLISAQQMHSDNDTGIMIATGKVEIVRGDYVLHADKVTYNQKTGVMTADGHVSLLMPTGEVEFAEHQEITGDMKQAFADNVGILFPDNSRMAAITTQRYEGRYTLANQASYTACNVCREDPNQPPLWQMRAETITHDNEEHEIFYHNATLDLAGIPVAYTPYMSGPDPTVKRLQGFLPPTVGYSTYVGAYAKTPYYFDIAPDKDMVLTPTFSETDKLQLASQYRERFANGQLLLNGSITQADLVDDSGVDKGEHVRGDMFGTFLYDIDNNWRAGSDVEYSSDKSYLERYQISSLSQTTSRAHVEGFNGRDYTVLNSYYFQDLRPGTDVSEPIILPSATFSALGDPGQAWGGRWSFDGNTLMTTRDNTGQTIAQQGPDTRRLSMNGGWQRQLISDTGLETTVSGLMRTDSYWANNVVADNGVGPVYNEAVFTRQFEQANAVMRYPMGRSGNGYQQLLEPIVSLTAAPDVRAIAKQPNEDSQDVEFDETNLFSPNRFTGSDLIEGGNRATYGVRNAVTTDSGGRIDIFGGESYDFSSNSQFPEQSGLTNHFSDYVGRVDFSPANWFNANYGFRLAESDFSPQRQDAYISTGVPIFRPWARYIQAYEDDISTSDATDAFGNIIPNETITTNQIEQVRQVTVGFSSNFSKYWAINANHVQAFDPSPGPRSDSLVLTYVDECLAFGVTLSHDDTNRLDLSSGTSASFHLYLKNLGGIHTDSATGATFPAEFRQTDQ